MTLAKIPALLALTAVAALGSPAIASAQDQPQQQPPPQQMQQQPQGPPAPMPAYASGEEEIHGRISQVGGKYQLSVRDDRGFVDNVTLHDGTVINPRGLTLQSGQAVSILGHTNGKTFEANEVDTPYGFRGGYGYGGGPYAVGVGFGGYYGPRYYGRFYGRF
ncbi:MAG: hypothetical protein IAI50_08610 [Candidatus Eremiobacteraeota bacterium]|nr:hypothetical protein [Candidatus Eremiobacteraeota bacterium]